MLPYYDVFFMRICLFSLWVEYLPTSLTIGRNSSSSVEPSNHHKIVEEEKTTVKKRVQLTFGRTSKSYSKELPFAYGGSQTKEGDIVRSSLLEFF